MILIDSDILIDIFDRDEQWAAWSEEQLSFLGRDHQLAITQVVVAEVGPNFKNLQEFMEALGDIGIGIEPLTDEGAFVSGLAFREHPRWREGPKSILADFLIGGQAVVIGAQILTRDPAIYTRYFPTVPLIVPDKDPT